MKIYDVYDFDPSEHRPPGDEANVKIARHHLWGQPFKVESTFQINQGSFDKYLDIYNGMNTKNITPNFKKIREKIKKYF